MTNIIILVINFIDVYFYKHNQQKNFKPNRQNRAVCLSYGEFTDEILSERWRECQRFT